MRYLTQSIEADLIKKMVLLAGPRQTGKTTLAKEVLNARSTATKAGVYLNWDDSDDRTTIRKKGWSEDATLIVLDEIHKYRKWKTWLKGIYDKVGDKQKFLVTGSARLDVYRRDGDSMFGRYHLWRLHPFCLAERPENLSPINYLERLLERGGFPEPLLSDDPTAAKRWRRERRDLILREDVRDLESVRDITSLSILLDELLERVGGPVVISHLANDLDVAHKTIVHWIDILAKMYLIFPVLPYARSLPRAMKKPPKIFFYDYGEINASNIGAKFENLVAQHLLKRLQFLEDSQGDRYDLRYLRDKEGHEVDFLILKNQKPIALIEAKWTDDEPHSALNYFGDRLDVSMRIQVVGLLKNRTVRQGIQIVPASEWLAQPLDQSIFN